MSDKTIDNRQQGQQARQDSLEFRDQPPGLEQITYGSISDAMARANWHLIAAAPDLLAALKAVVAISDRKHDAWDAARAAIAKAEGQPQ